jgi:hypothetical protein
MAIKLTKDENEQRDELVAELEIAGGALHTAMEEVAEMVKEANEIAAAAIAAYNEALADAREFVETTASRLRDELDGRSEKWLESDKGQAAIEFVEQWEGETFDDLEWEDIDPPEQPDPEWRDTLENLPDEAAS